MTTRSINAKCTRITTFVQWVGTKVCDIHSYEGLPNFESFLIYFEEKVSEPQRLLALDVALKATPTRWCVTYKQSILECPQCRRFLEIRFCENMIYTGQKYIRLTNPIDHIEHCHATWETLSQQEWVH